MNQDKKQNREYVEAVPGPAIVISKETYKKMQENNDAKHNQKRLKKCAELFRNIEDKTESQEGPTF